MKKIVKLMAFLTMLLLAIFLFLVTQVRVRRVVYFAIYPYSTTEDTHVLEIFSDNRIEYYYGVREAEIVNEIKFKELEKRQTMKIKKEQLKQIRKFIKDIEAFGDLSLEGPGWDSLEILLITNKNRINILYPPLEKQYKIIEGFKEYIEKVTGVEF